MAFAHREFGAGGHEVDYDFIPTAVFSQPNVGTVGYTEEEARRSFGRLDIYRSEYRPMKHTLSGRDERSMMKLIVDQASQRVCPVQGALRPPKHFNLRNIKECSRATYTAEIDAIHQQTH